MAQVLRELPDSNQPISGCTARVKLGWEVSLSHTVSGHVQLKSPLGKLAPSREFPTKQLPTILNKHAAFHTAQSGGLSKSGSDTVQFLPSPGVARLPNFSGVGIHSPSGCIQLRCVSHFVSISPSDFQNPGPSWCQAAHLALVGERAGDLTLLPIS